MKIGIEMNSYPCSVEEQLALMKKHGFEATFCFALAKNLEEIAQLCQQYGITPENFHAPFSHMGDMWLDVPEGEEMLKELTDSVDNCKKYGVDTLVVHHSSGAVPFSEIGISRFERLVNYAKENGVTLAFENISFKLSRLAYLLEEYPEVGFCWDVGHEQAYAHGRQFMPLFGDRIAALHMHDNHCEHMGDTHMIPFDGQIDFDRVTTQLAQANYQKAIMLEVMACRTEAYLAMGADAFYEKAAHVARKLAEETERKMQAEAL